MPVTIRYDVPAAASGEAAYFSGWSDPMARRMAQQEEHGYSLALQQLQQQQAAKIAQDNWERDRKAYLEDAERNRNNQVMDTQSQWANQRDVARANWAHEQGVTGSNRFWNEEQQGKQWTREDQVRADNERIADERKKMELEAEQKRAETRKPNSFLDYMKAIGSGVNALMTQGGKQAALEQARAKEQRLGSQALTSSRIEVAKSILAAVQSGGIAPNDPQAVSAIGILQEAMQGPKDAMRSVKQSDPFAGVADVLVEVLNSVPDQELVKIMSSMPPQIRKQYAAMMLKSQQRTAPKQYASETPE